MDHAEKLFEDHPSTVQTAENVHLDQSVGAGRGVDLFHNDYAFYPF
jgi:hypothetical protein